jgi:hypothetical protein
VRGWLGFARKDGGDSDFHMADMGLRLQRWSLRAL